MSVDLVLELGLGFLVPTNALFKSNEAQCPKGHKLPVAHKFKHCPECGSGLTVSFTSLLDFLKGYSPDTLYTWQGLSIEFVKARAPVKFFSPLDIQVGSEATNLHVFGAILHTSAPCRIGTALNKPCVPHLSADGIAAAASSVVRSANRLGLPEGPINLFPHVSLKFTTVG